MAGPDEHDHVLPDGTTVHLRPVRPDDAERLLAMWERTSPESRHARFLGELDVTPDNVRDFVELDAARDHALVATLGRGEEERIVGVARYTGRPDDPGSAEFGALVEDEHQGRGIGTALMRHVARTAAERGVRRLAGDLLADNTRMLQLLEQIGLDVEADPVEASGRGGRLRADVDVTIDADFLRVVDEDERAAARAAVARFFHPERVAVVGASRDPSAIGGLVLRNLLDGRFQGAIYPVNPNAKHVQGVAAYPSLAACPEVPDLVLVCVPQALVERVVDEAGELGVRAVCVISAGFAELGDHPLPGPDGTPGASGVERQQHLLDVARGHGLRIVGPNCMGLMNAAGEFRMNGTFSATFPKPGRLAFSSQSGALGLAVLEHVHELGLGISSFVSVGNKADISGNDLLLYWEQDPATDVVLLYLESFGNPRKFSRIARRISRTKPIVAVKSGRTSAGVRAASSHTAAISSGDIAVEALFRQTGVVRTDTLEELFDVATLLSQQPLPGGKRVAILTNAGGPGILAADALESAGMVVPPLEADTIERLREFLPAEAGLGNPVDMIASANPANYEAAIRVLGNADEVDALYVIFIEAGGTTNEGVAKAVLRARGDVPADVPLVMVAMAGGGEVPELESAGIPVFRFPEDAARALGRVAAYAAWRQRPLGKPVVPDGIDAPRARSLVEAALRQAGSATTSSTGKRLIGQSHANRAIGQKVHVPAGQSTWLSAVEADALLDAYGIARARSVAVRDAEQAAAAFDELTGGRGTGAVVVKLAAPIHKADVGGVRVGITTAAGAAKAVAEIRDAVVAAGMPEHADRFLVQEMVEDGVEMVVGVSHDPSFGPLVMTGMGGTLVELHRDVSVRVTPLTDVDVDEMLDGLRMKPLLTGYRGSAPKDVAALRDLLFRINALVEDLPEVAELDLNPVFVRDDGNGVVAVDVRVKVVQP